MVPVEITAHQIHTKDVLEITIIGMTHVVAKVIMLVHAVIPAAPTRIRDAWAITFIGMIPVAILEA